MTDGVDAAAPVVGEAKAAEGGAEAQPPPPPEASPAAPSAPRRPVAIVLLILLCAGGALGGALAYTQGRASNLAAFSGVFSETAAEVRDTLQRRLAAQLTAVRGCARERALLAQPAVDATAGAAPWSFDAASFAAFQELTALQLANSGARTISWSFLVTQPRRAAYEAAAAAAAAGGALDAVLAARLALPLQGSSNTSVSAPPQPLYLPIWDVAPAAGRHIVGFDILSNTTGPERAAALTQMFATGNMTTTDLLPHVLVASTYAPAALMYAPGVSAAGAVIGACALGFEWPTLLVGALPLFVSSVTVVVSSPTGRQTTIFIQGNGTTATPGDTHDTSLDRYTASFMVPLGDGDGDANSTWTLTLHPTSALLQRYMSDRPATNAIIIVLVVSGFGFCFAVYELHRRKKNNALLDALAARLSEVIVLKAEVERASAHEKQVQKQALADGIRQKDEFVSMVSHEIRTPLNAVQGATTLLQDTSPLTDEQRELLALLDAGSSHVVLIVEDILLHGALASGNFPVVREPLTLISAVIEPAVTTLSLQPSLQDKLADLKLVRNVDPEVPAMIMGDASRLLQVCINLLSNAVKFTPAGGRVQLLVDCMPAPELSSDAAVTAAEDDEAPRPRNWLRIRVVDSGIGVKADKLAKIFLPFTQAEQSTVRQYGGTGLGLTICQRIAHAMGGHLSAHSEGEGMGTTMEFAMPLLQVDRRTSGRMPGPTDSSRSLPPQPLGLGTAPGRRDSADQIRRLRQSLAEQVAPASPREEQPPAIPSPRRLSMLAGVEVPMLDGSVQAKPLRVLVAEDDRLSQTLMKRLMPKMGFEATVVDNGQSAVDAVCASAPCEYDLVLMDLHMPIMDGLTAIRNILANLGDAAPPIVALTASCSDEEKQRCDDAGVSGFLTKPIKVAQMGTLHEVVLQAQYKRSSASPRRT